MMPFNLFVRRLHLYLALFLLPWFFIYGLSSLPFSHRTWFDKLYDDGVPTWNLRLERPYDRPVPANANLREIGGEIMKDLGIKDAFGVYQPNDRQLNVYAYTFRTATQVTYHLDKKLIRVEDRRFRWDQFLTGMHARGGFENKTVLNIAWAIVVDVVCIGFLLWIATGIYMWWQIPRTRYWGYLALGAGTVLFAVFLTAL